MKIRKYAGYIILGVILIAVSVITYLTITGLINNFM